MVNENTMKILNLFLRCFKKATKQKSTRKFGWKKDLHDPRDFRYKVSAPTAPREVPPLIDMRPQFPSVYDQGELGSCTGNALAGAYQFGDMKQGHPSFIPSRLFIYYNERVIENTINKATVLLNKLPSS